MDSLRTSEIRFRYCHSMWQYPHPPPHHQADQPPVPLPTCTSAPASLLLQRVLYRASPSSAKEEAELLEVAGLRNLRAPTSTINWENLTKGTVQPDASQHISLTGSPQSPNLRLQGNQEDTAGFGEGARTRGEREQEPQSFVHGESTFPWAEAI